MHSPGAATVAMLVATVALASCAAAAAGDTSPSSPAVTTPTGTTGSVTASTTSPTPTASPKPTTSPAAFAPRPNVRIPTRGATLAAAAERATRSVRASVVAWLRDGDPSTWPPPRLLVLQTLYQQRIYRLLARRPALASAVLRALPTSIRREAEAIVRANADVFAHATPVRPSFSIRTRAPDPASDLLRYFRQAERRFGVPWWLLAAVNYTETKFGRVVSNSAAGAQGPMQFLPSTWAAYGLGGDIHDPHDAILGAANYLRANGAPDDIRGALYHYNPVDSYVDAVATYAAAIRRDSRLYYAMYCWQVYVLTTRGDRRVTGPGL